VRDLRVASSAVNRFEVKNGNSDAGIHVRISSWDPEMIQIQVFEQGGVNVSEKRQKDIEKYYGRQDFRRAFYSEFGEIQFPDRAMETYVRRLMRNWDLERIRSRAYRLIVDYSYSPASLTLPNILGSLDAEVLSLRAFSDQRRTTMGAEELGEHIAEVGRLVRTMDADLGLVVDPGAERLYIVDDQGAEVPMEKALLLFVKLVAQQAGRGEKIVLPLTVTHIAERLARPFDVEVVRTKVSLPALAQASTADGVVFAGSLGGGYIFPAFLPAFDAVMSLGKLLELLAPQALPLSAQVADIPASTLVHKTVGCPWSLKGTVMRTATEVLQRQGADDGAEIALLDGVCLQREDGWVQLLPDADEPVFHVYAEGEDREQSVRLAEGILDVVNGVIANYSD
jgi:mannose-1-phosphate guanylyltransferase/phosphomannomutase